MFCFVERKVNRPYSIISTPPVHHCCSRAVVQPFWPCTVLIAVRCVGQLRSLVSVFASKVALRPVECRWLDRLALGATY